MNVSIEGDYIDLTGHRKNNNAIVGLFILSFEVSDGSIRGDAAMACCPDRFLMFSFDFERVINVRLGYLGLFGLTVVSTKRRRVMTRWVKPSILAILVVCVFFQMEMVTFAKTPFGDLSVVRQKCAVCHKLDEKGRVEVIEETRMTPEEWKVVVERMIRINGGPIDDRDFDPVIKELSKYLILTPEEMSEVAYINSDENSQYREIPKNKTEERMFAACVRCHTYAKIRSHRKTPDQWKENRQMHLGYYPTVVGQMREMDWPKESQDLVDVLAKELPMDTPNWQDWMNKRTDQDLTGRWQIAGFQPGLGYYEGNYRFKPNPQKGEDSYIVEKEVRYENGQTISLLGEGTLYGEYHLRYALNPTPLMGKIEGVFDLDAATMGFKGKWWAVVQDAGAYGDEMFYKDDGSPRVFSHYPKSLRTSGEAQMLTLIGVNLPTTIKEGDVQFSVSGMKVVKIEKADPTIIVCRVVPNSDLSPCTANISVKGVTCEESVIVFDKIDRIKIFPELGRARVSCGAAYPPQGVQFVAFGVNNGTDGKPDTQDDFIMDPVDVKWWLEEEKTREGDDDLKYLMAAISNGIYTPVTTYAPIETRTQRREGVGLIAVGASFKEGDRELKSRSLLVVTDPDFVNHIK